MSQFYEEDVFRQMEEDGTAQWIRDVVKSQDEDAPQATAETPEEDTVEAAEEVTPAEDPEETEDPETELAETPEAEQEEEPLYLELSPEAEALLKEKYGGDLNKMLNAMPDAQSAIGRQGNELGSLRSELAQFRAEVQAGLSRPHLEWPQDDAEPEEAVRMYRSIADEAFERQDAETFGRAMTAWQEIDPLGNEAWAMMKATQVMVAQSRDQREVPEPQNIQQGVAALAETYPQLREPDFQKEVSAQLEKFPTLQRTFQDETAPPSERIAALEEATKLVASRRVDGDVQQSLRRVAVKVSEEARQNRAEARVATGGGRGNPTEPTDRMIPVGDTGHEVGEKELQERILEASGMNVQIGRGSSWKPSRG